MLTNHSHIKLSVVFALALATCFSTSAMAQNAAGRTDTPNKGVLSVQFTASGETSTKPHAQPTPETVASAKKPAASQDSATVATSEKPVAKPTPGSGELEAEIAALKAENAAVREQMKAENEAVTEQFRRMQEGQKTLLDLVESLKKKLDTAPTAVTGPQIGPPTTSDAVRPVTAYPPLPTSVAAITATAVSKQAEPERYQDGIILWKTPDDAKVPFLLRFNNNTQFRFLNTMDSPGTFTDHLGVVREVHTRNDLTVNRSMFILGGYIFDKRVRFSLTVWTSAGSASIVVAGNIGWQFNKHLTLIGGYFGVPGSRSLVNTFPYYTSTDRSMADNFFRPGFTQGVTALGEIRKGLNYNVFVGNSLNTLSISAAKIDTNLMYAGSLWWEPFGDYAPPGKSQEMYDDYSGERKVRMRIGTSFTRSREDRFSNLDVSNPDNTALYNSDGVLTFSTGAFAPGVTVDKALYNMWAIDWGLKYHGLAINGQYYSRWLSQFEADGPMPLTSTFDHGYELSAGYFVVPRKVMVYARSSQVWGEFKNPYEYGAGVKWHFLPTERLWINAELMKVKGAPYSGAFSPYTAGMSGWVPMIQTVIAF